MDAQTRCAHYGSEVDVIALRCACCDAFWPCHDCHVEVTGRAFTPWPNARFEEPAVLCGVCHQALTACEYLSHSHGCPRCGTAFNPGCAAHHGLYFALAEPADTSRQPTACTV